MWILRTVSDQVPEHIFRILPSSIKTLGRAAGVDFVLDAQLVSRVHCRFTVDQGGELTVTDLESTNGTFLNDERVTTASVHTGDRLRVGRVEIVAVWDGAVH